MNTITVPSASVEVPASACVPCPKVQFKNLRVAKNCPGCEFFGGLVQVSNVVGETFVQRFRVACAHPVTRTMIEVEA